MTPLGVIEKSGATKELSSILASNASLRFQIAAKGDKNDLSRSGAASQMNAEATNLKSESLKVIITGATGMVGEGVMLECLNHPAVAQVLIVNRRPYPAQHPKLRECIVPDFLALDGFTTQLTGYDACFFCAGISSAGMSEADYTRVTYDVTTNFAQKLASLNTQMTFDYVSGAYTDSSEQGRIMWARVKGKTENALMRLPFRQVYIFRPGFMLATPGQRNLKWYYYPFAALYPLVRAVFPNHVSTLRDVARAMINTVLHGYPKKILEIKDINALGKA
jgi:nucleoside-diphosphate-sugar epimerase